MKKANLTHERFKKAALISLLAVVLGGCFTTDRPASLKDSISAKVMTTNWQAHPAVEQPIPVATRLAATPASFPAAARAVIGASKAAPHVKQPVEALICKYRGNCHDKCMNLLPIEKMTSIRHAVKAAKEQNIAVLATSIEHEMAEYESLPEPRGTQRMSSIKKDLRIKLIFDARVYWHAAGATKNELRDELMKRVATIANCEW